MRRRYRNFVATLPPLHFQPAIALRKSAFTSYSPSLFRRDLLAGVVVGIIALPLSMALAIAAGLRPESGLYTAIVAGALAALLGGSRVQISGPTASFVIIAPIAAHFGFAGLALATVMAGIILALMGLCRLGRLIEFIPYPVVSGFTAGIAVVLVSLQLKDFLGLDLPVNPNSFLERLAALAHAISLKLSSTEPLLARAADPAIGLFTLALLILLPKLNLKIPSPLLALPLAALATYLGHRFFPDFNPATIASRFGSPTNPSGIPQSLPPLILPWHEPGPPGPDGQPQPLAFSLQLVHALLPAAFAIAILGAMESLLSAVVADGITGQKHDPDAELLAQGTANIAAPFLGGFAATGALARTITNIRAGAHTPIAAITCSAFLLLTLLVLAPLLGLLPMAAMAALSFIVAKNMAEFKHVLFVFRFAPRGDVAVLVTGFALTVLFDMVTAVTAGFILAAILFMQRMVQLNHVRLVSREHPAFSQPIPKSIMLYEIGGPLFFGAAQKAMASLESIGDGTRAVILDFTGVATIDATGLVSLDSLVSRLRARKVLTILAHAPHHTLDILHNAGWDDRDNHLIVAGSVEAAVEIARAWIESDTPPPPTPSTPPAPTPPTTPAQP